MGKISLNNYQLWVLCRYVANFQPTDTKQLASKVFCLELLEELGVGPIIDKYQLEQKEAYAESQRLTGLLAALNKKHKSAKNEKKKESLEKEMAIFEGELMELNKTNKVLSERHISVKLFTGLIKRKSKKNLYVIMSDITNHGSNPTHMLQQEDMKAIHHLLCLFKTFI